MSTSYNGWPVLTPRTTGDLPRLRVWIIPGTEDPQTGKPRHILLRDGSAGFLLVHLALWFHERIERIDRGVWDEWGWADRPVRGSTTTVSNHASGTAEDLNATRLPMGRPVEQLLSRVLRARVWVRLRFYRGLIVWGAAWQRPDAMHFELAGGTTLAAVERRARRLMRTPRGRRILAANPGARKVIES